jgi:hypothetical protein
MTRPSPLPFALAAFTALLPARAQRGDVPADKARIIFVHTLDAARDRPLSAWTNRAGYAPLVERSRTGAGRAPTSTPVRRATCRASRG